MSRTPRCARSGGPPDAGRPFTLYGWHLSFYAGKVRCYLANKGIPFRDREVSLYTLTRQIKRRTGAVVMPVVVTPEGDWLQDSSAIIDELERRFPEYPVLPATPVQRFASVLLETWGDEWWIPIAMHTRWSHPENYVLFESDAGPALLPYFPGFLQKRAVARVARLLRSYLPQVGIVPDQLAMMDAWTRSMLDSLDAHFAQHRYLLGGRPTIGDFGLVGTMYGHLGRDPWPKRELVDPRKNLRAWIDRMAKPVPGASGDLPAADRIPPSLDPVWQSIVREFLPMIEAILENTRALAAAVPEGQPLPRNAGEVVCPMGNGQFRRGGMPFAIWKMQRLLDIHRAMPPEQQSSVRVWLRSIGGERMLDLEIPRLKRVALRVALA